MGGGGAIGEPSVGAPKSVAAWRQEWEAAHRGMHKTVEQQLWRQDRLFADLLRELDAARAAAVEPIVVPRSPMPRPPGRSKTAAALLEVQQATSPVSRSAWRHTLSPSSLELKKSSAISVGSQLGAQVKADSVATHEACILPIARRPVAPQRSLSTLQTPVRQLPPRVAARVRASNAALGVSEFQICVEYCLEVADRRGMGERWKDFWRFASWVEYQWRSLQEPVREGRLAAVIQSQPFEILCGVVILLNSVFTIVRANEGLSMASSRPVGTGDSHWEAEQARMDKNVELGFLCFYVAELILKLKVHGRYFFCNNDARWNVFDVFVVGLAVYQYAYLFLSSGATKGSIGLGFVRSFRIMKVTRIFRMIRFFRELRTMLNTIIGSFMALFWCLVMLMFILILFSLIFVQSTAGHISENDIGTDQVGELMKYFGSVEIAMTSLFMATTGGVDWIQLFGLLSPMGAENAALLLFYIAFFNFAVYNVLTGIFVEHTQKVSRRDRDALTMEQRRKESNVAAQLRRLVMEMDSNRDGKITWEELVSYLRDDKVATFLASIGLDIQDAEVFFKMLSDISDSEEVDMDTFVHGCLRMKGNATSIDMQSLAYETKIIHEKVDALLAARETLHSPRRRTMSRQDIAVMANFGGQADLDYDDDDGRSHQDYCMSQKGLWAL